MHSRGAGPGYWRGANTHELINGSYDPTRELHQALNPMFVSSYAKISGVQWTIVQSHDGFSRQAL